MAIGVYERTAETRAKMSTAMQGNQRALGHKRTTEMRIAMQGRICTPETRAKLSAANMGRIRTSRTPETCAKISATRRANAPYILIDKSGYAILRFLGGYRLSHRLAAVYYWGAEAVREMVVHHNELAHDKLDNRRKCLTLMTRSDHARHYQRQDTRESS